MTDLDYLPATDLARLIRERAISPGDAVEHSLARIERVNPTLNAFCFTYADEARAVARAAEAAVMRGDPLGPLHGVPVAFKDFTPTKGRRTTLGSYAYEHWIPDEDAPVVESVARAGAILVGKTTTPELAHSGFTESALWGVTRNPWDPQRTPGGSSGGSGAAVAAGCVPLAEGSDMGGSIRIPAAACGVVGLKPSFGRIPFTGAPGLFDQIPHFGPLARTVADAALFLSVAQGPDERDPQSIPTPIAVPLPPPPDVRGLRLALSVDLGFFRIDPEVEANTRAAAAALADAGAAVEEVDLGWTAAMNDAWGQHWSVYLAANFGHLLPQWRDRMAPSLVALMDEGFAMDAVRFKRLEILRTQQWQRLRPVLERFDALLCPTLAIPAPPVGGSDADYTRVDADGRLHGYDLCALFNLVSACPVLSVPSGWTAAGLPTGLQIVGRRHDDLGVLRIGAALEASQPRAHCRPPV